MPGGYFGVDFSPVVDRIRVVSNLDSNVRLNPTSGVISTIDTSLAYAVGDPNFGANPEVTHIAYTNSFAGATSTTLFAIDVGLDVLVRVGAVGGTPVSPNTGQLVTIGPLGVDATSSGGFDIDRRRDLPGPRFGSAGSRISTRSTSRRAPHCWSGRSDPAATSTASPCPSRAQPALRSRPRSCCSECGGSAPESGRAAADQPRANIAKNPRWWSCCTNEVS